MRNSFQIFINNLAYLWPVYAFFLALLFVVLKFFLDWVKAIVEKIKRKKEEKLLELVMVNSDWYKKILELNSQTKFYADVVDNGHSIYYVNINNKAKYDKTLPIDGFFEFLSLHREKVERALEQVHRNRVINEVYNKSFSSYSSTVSPERCNELGIKYDRFLEAERKIVRESRLRIVHTYAVTCYVCYASPQGRNQYSKHMFFDESRIYAGLMELDRKNAFYATEEWRRKSERAKVTPALRYDVMQRDGFKCRLCGRSAQSGIELEVDHIIPVSKGGNSAFDNLQTLCRDCNRGKGVKM